MIPSPIKVLLRGSSELWFFLVRHNADLTQGVNFHNPCVGRLWELRNMGFVHMDLLDLTKLIYVAWM
jgi:hypothetical protein